MLLGNAISNRSYLSRAQQLNTQSHSHLTGFCDLMGKTIILFTSCRVQKLQMQAQFSNRGKKTTG